ncbi:CHAT domain-containing protein [Streptomyces sp. NPDC060048]|uniref:CHAT domain-containing protein n=1 Tax=unclassified Streptomyces TaxID=2593676 RepID=UPI003675B55C
MDWEAIGQGAWPDNGAFTSLSPERQLDEIRVAVRWVGTHQRSDPAGCHRIAVTAVHLLDSQGHGEARLRGALGLALGLTATLLGDEAEALLHFGEILRRPEDLETRSEREDALIFYATLISGTDPERAFEMLSSAIDSDLRQGNLARAANISITLGSLHRRRKQGEEARQTYEKALRDLRERDPREPDIARITAALHGNLGNLLTDDLGRHQEAAEHFAEAVPLFEAAGEHGFADDRYFHLLCARIAAGEHLTALGLLRAGQHRIDRHPEAFRRFLMEGPCFALLESELPEWLTLFEHIRVTGPQEVVAEVEALLLATQIVIRIRKGDATGAMTLAHDLRLRALPECELFAQQLPLMGALAREYDCYGMLWSYPLPPDLLNNGQRIDLKTRHTREVAAARLFALARQPGADGSFPDEEALREMFGPPVTPGIGSAPDEPPAWLGPANRQVRERYRRLRQACPSPDELIGEFTDSHVPSHTPQGQPLPHREPLLRRAVRAADLLGTPELMVRSRVNLAGCIARDIGGVPSDSLRESLAVLREARTIAEGLPRMEVRVSLAAATVLKESHGGDEAARIEAAIEEGRQAMSLAQRHGFRDVLPEAAITLGNALSDYADVGLPRLREARTVFERGLTALRTEPHADSDFLEATLLNSLGLVFQKAGDLENPQCNRLAAADCYRKALVLRECLGNRDRELRTLGNLLGCLIETHGEEGAANTAEAVRLARRIQQLAPLAADPAVQASSLSNAAVALRTVDLEAAKATALEAVHYLRSKGPSRLLILALYNAGRAHLDCGDAAGARNLLEEAVCAIEEFRRLGAASRYRAELTRSFATVYGLLGTVLERLDAPEEDRWWAVERHTSRTLTESRGVTPLRDDVLSGLERSLPAEVVLLQVYVSGEQELGCFVLRNRDGRLTVQDGRHRLPLRSLAVGTGGGVDEHGILIPAPTPALEEQFHYQMSWIGSRFLTPLLNDIDLAGISRVAIASRDLRHLPWHAMPGPPGGEPLGRAFELVGVPNAAFLAQVAGTPDPPLRKSAFVACDPSGTLRQHIQECRHAFSVLSVPDKIVLTDTSRPVSKRALLRIVREVDLFHFAGHSRMVPGRPDLSGLLLSDGLLSVPELEEACGEHAPSLVFLSSCESGSQDSTLEDAPNLSTVFLQAGARVVIGAAWKVPDSIAALTARRFYENLATADPVGALRLARTQVMDTVTGAHWAAFVAQGWSAVRGS